jgi:hypothetical protein
LQAFFKNTARDAAVGAIYCLAALSLLPAVAVAEDITGSKDLAEIERFPDASIVRFAEQQQSDYTLALSKVRKVNGVWQLEKERRLKGDLSSITYQLAKTVSADEAYTHFAEQLTAQADVLFRCKARACGSSNQWANFVFGEKRLYGPQDGQRYLAVKRGDDYYVLYVIKRGNKRVYVRLDRLTGAAVSVAGEAAAERFSFTRYPLQRNEQLTALARRWLLQALPVLRDSEQMIWVVAHRSAKSAESVEQLLQLSQQDAQLLKQSLIERGIDAARIETFAVGPLAPLNGANAEGRIELLLLNP